MGKINIHNYEAFLIDYLDGNLNEDVVAELRAFILANPQLEIDLEDEELPFFTNEESPIDFKNDLKKTEVFIEDEELIDYLENNLSEADKKTFEIKLLRDKELALKLQAYSKTILSKEVLAFENKLSLYKTDDEVILNNSALAYLEDQLSLKEKAQFESELKTSTALQKELSSLQKTKLVADNLIVFEEKESLKKEARVIVLFNFRTVASVAAAILLLFTLAFVFNYYNSKPDTEATHIAKVELKSTKNELIIKDVHPDKKINNTLPENTNYTAKNSTLKNNINKNEEVMLNEIVTNSVVGNEEKKNIEQELSKDPSQSKTIALNNNKTDIDTTNSNLVSNSEQPKFFKQNYLIATEVDDDAALIAEAPAKKSFWQRAAQLAKQVNKLGVKAIDGEETGNKGYSLSFNSFSVEKK